MSRRLIRNIGSAWIHVSFQIDPGSRPFCRNESSTELKYLKPLKAGDTLDCDSYLHSIRQARGTDIIVTKNIVTNQDGELVQETYTTRAARSDDDGEQGFSGATS